MDSTDNSSFLLNDSDLRLSTSLCQWAGFELDCETQQTETSKDHSATMSMTTNEKKNVCGGNTSGEPISPQHDGEKADEMLEVVREFLLEKTSQFYNDIIDAQGEKLEKAGFSMERLRKRYEMLRSQTASVVDRFHIIGIEEELNNRLKSIDAALRQLSIMKTPATATLSLSSSDSGRSSTDELGLTNSSPLHQWRQWIESTEIKVGRMRQKIDWYDKEQLEQRLKVQQALQTQIEQEGGQWLTIVQKYVDSWSSSHRRRIVLASIERRWHALWIKSLEWQCRLERQIRSLLMGITDSNKEDGDSGEPLAKRRRLSEDFSMKGPHEDQDLCEQTSLVATVDDLCSDDVCSATSDTIPFSENEYEPLTPRSALTSHHEEEPNSARDGGYSSGSSAVVARFDIDQVDEKPKQLDVIEKRQFSSTGSSPCLERRTRIENSPVKCFYKMTPTTPDEQPSIDGSRQNPEKKKSMPTRLSDDALYVYTQPFVVPPPELTDSLLVNVGDTMSETLDNSNNENNVDDLEEILNLFRQGQERDTFETELEELLLRRQGTVWVPLLHDEEAEDERREQTPTAIVETPPNTPSFAPPIMNLPRIASSGSLKRRRREENRRTVSTSVTASNNSESTKDENIRHSESAVVSGDYVGDSNLSSSWPANGLSPTVDERDFENSLLNVSRSGRKKLRACRLRRSWSYGVQFETNGHLPRRFAADLLQHGRGSGVISPTRPNTAVSNTDDENRDTLGSANNVPSDGSDQSIEDCSDVMTGGGETMAEQVSECDGVLGGNIAVWEWDDYKPPKHNESGPVDQPPLDDSMLTAFGDDYCAYLEEGSTPRTFDRLVDGSNTSSPLSLSTRLPPIGISFDSDMEENFQVIKDSQQELRSIYVALKKNQTRDSTSADGSDVVDFLSTCEYNIGRLEPLVESAPPLRKRNKSKDEKDLAADLLQDWRDLALLLTRQLLECSPPANVKGRTRSSEEEERFVQALQSELRRLTTSLQNVIAQGSVRSLALGTSIGGNAYKSLEETQEILDILKSVRRSLTSEKIRLDCVMQEYNMSVHLLSTRCDAISEEVAQLRSYFEQAYQSCNSQLRELEMLRQQWSLWRQTEELCRHLVAKIGSELTHSDFKALQSDLAFLEERISRLEIIFSKLLSCSSARKDSSTSTASIDESVLDELKERTKLLRQDLDELKASVPLENGQSVVASGKATRRKRSHDSTLDDRNESIKKEESIQPQERKRLTSLRRLLIRSWPIQLCVCLLVCLNVFFFYPSCCEHMNRYWWSLGPKQHYSHGPPPT